MVMYTSSEMSWSNRLEENVRLLNLGIPNGTTRELRQALQMALGKELKSDLVTIWTGANDLVRGQAPEDFENDLSALLRELRNRTPLLL